MSRTINVLACVLALGAAPGTWARTRQEDPDDFPEESEDPPPSPAILDDPDAPRLPPWVTRFGVMLDASAPEGVGVSALMQPERWARVYGGPTRNTLGYGVRAGATFIPLQVLVSPTVELDIGLGFNADYDKLLTRLRGQPSTAATRIHDVSYAQVTGRFGLEFSPWRPVTLFGGVGLSYWYFQVNGAESFIKEAPEDPDLTAKPLSIHLTSPAAKLGLIVHFN